jgi:hypothetical protein
MQAYLDLVVKEVYWETEKTQKKGISDFLRSIWENIWAVKKYVTYDKDAIFMDRNWPYLWS